MLEIGIQAPATALPRARRAPWLTFAVLYGMFYILTPFDLVSSLSGYTMESHSGEINQALDTIEGGTALRKIVLIALGLLGLVSLLRQGVKWIRVKNPMALAVVAFIGLAGLSPLWADDPEFTARRVMVLVMMSLGALALAGRWSQRDIMLFGFFCTTLTLAIGLGSEVVLGTFRPWEGSYRFSGVMHPNAMGANCAILLIAAVALAQVTDRGRWRFIGAAGVACVFLWLTKSRGAGVAGLLGLAVCLALISTRRSTVMAVLITVPLLIGGLLFGDQILEAGRYAIQMGRPDAELSTLTGRTYLWKQLLGYLADRPLLGFGYDSFWTPTHILQVAEEQNWIVGSSHSGYLDIALSLGVVGLVPYSLFLIWALARAVRSVGRSADLEALFAVGVLIWLLSNMAVEVILLDTSLSSFICMIIIARLAFVHDGGDFGAYRRI